METCPYCDKAKPGWGPLCAGCRWGFGRAGLLAFLAAVTLGFNGDLAVFVPFFGAPVLLVILACLFFSASAAKRLTAKLGIWLLAGVLSLGIVWGRGLWIEPDIQAAIVEVERFHAEKGRFPKFDEVTFKFPHYIDGDDPSLMWVLGPAGGMNTYKFKTKQRRRRAVLLT